MPKNKTADLVIHVGHGKTGTSAIQSFLALNQAKLREFGVIYPDNGSLSSAAKGKISSGNGNIAIKYNDFCKNTDEVLLFSDENLFWTITEDTLNNFKKMHGNVKIILWSRNLLEFSYSEWGQYVKRHGITLSYGDFLLKYNPQHHIRVLWWLQTVKNLDIEIVFRNYSNCKDKAIDAFCADLSLNINKLTYPLQPVVNRSLTHIEYEFQRVANAITGDGSSSQYLSDVLCNEYAAVRTGMPFIGEEIFDIISKLHSTLLDEINQMVNASEKLLIGSKSQYTKKSSTQEILSREQIRILAEGLIKICSKNTFKQSSPDKSDSPQGLHATSIENLIDPDQMQNQIALHKVEQAQKLDSLQVQLAKSQEDIDQPIQQVSDLQEQLDRANFTVQKLEFQVEHLGETLVMLKLRPLRAVKQKIIYKTLRSLIKLDKILPYRTIERFKQSAKKRNPRRKLYDNSPAPQADVQPAAQPTSEYQIVLNQWADERQKQTALLHDLKSQLDGFVRFSVIVPVYNPDIPYLDAMIQSVQAQSYDNWELCLADDLSRAEVRDFLTQKAAQDSRVRLVLRGENGHISRATNSAIDVATGDFIALLDHDDLLDPDALLMVAAAIADNPTAQILYSDEDKVRMDGERYDPHFKPDWNRDLLYGMNYVSHLGVYATALVKQVGGFRVGFEGAQDYDLLLRCIEQIDDTQILHIPKVLYSWRASPGSTAASNEAKPYATQAGIWALSEHLERVHGRPIDVVDGPSPFSYRVLWPLDTPPLVSLIIPTRDRLHLTRTAVESILAKTKYENFEVIIIDNGSIEPDSLAWFAKIQSVDCRVRVLRDDQPFNYSALNNTAVAQARGELIALLNNDVEIINREWLSEMVSLAIRPGTGCVGAKLYYPDGRIQHAGVVIGMGGVAGHAHLLSSGDHGGYFGRLLVRQAYSAVTAACLVVRRDIYLAVDGLNETDLKVAFNDVDFCLKVRAAGYTNIWTPWAELLHYESASRGYEDTPEKISRFQAECAYMKNIWQTHDFADPCYNPNLTLDRQDFSFAHPQWPIPSPR